MAETKRKGLIAELAVMAEATKRGYPLYLPLGEDTRSDLVVERRGVLERVQVKYEFSNGQYVRVRCLCSNNWVTTKYKPTEIEWIATYDAASGLCYFVPSSLLAPEGSNLLHLRL